MMSTRVRNPIPTDAKLTDLGRMFEQAKADARPLNRERKRLYGVWKDACKTAGLSDDRGAASNKLMKDTGYLRAVDAFSAKHSEAVSLMKAINRKKPTSIEEVAIKLDALTFDIFDFELDPVGGDVAERLLLRLCKQVRALAGRQEERGA